MKLRSGWVATGLLLFAVLACNLSKNNNNANKNTNENKSARSQPTRPANADVYVNRVYMAKDKNGQPGDETTSYEPSDHKVHCFVVLNKAKKGTAVRFIWKIMDVEGEKDKEIRTIDYTTNSFENNVHAHLELPSDWPKGTYRVEVYINGNLDKTIDYTIG